MWHRQTNTYRYKVIPEKQNDIKIMQHATFKYLKQFFSNGATNSQSKFLTFLMWILYAFKNQARAIELEKQTIDP